MKKQASVVLFSALFALAGVTSAEPYGDNTNEQKATQAVEQELAEVTELMNSACGTNITTSIDWKAYASFTESDRAGRTMSNIYEISESQTMSIIRDIASGCSDAIFKANVVKKVKSIKFSPTKEKEVNAKIPSHKFKVANGVLSVSYNFQTSNDSISTVKEYL
jgi:hypothetical protein